MTTPIAKRQAINSRDSPLSSPGTRSSRASTPTSDRTSVSGTGIGTASGTATSGTASSLARTRSVRSGTPVSARAAVAAQRRESMRANGSHGSHGSIHGHSMSMSISAGHAAKSAAAIEAEEQARAETLALLDDLKARLSQAELAGEQHRRRGEAVQSQLEETQRERDRLEERTHEYEEQTEALSNEKRDMARRIQQMESIYEAERSAMNREKEDFANREEEMQTIIQRLKDSLAQRVDDEGRPSRQTNSPSLEGAGFAPPSSLQRSDSRNNSKLLLQKDKLIESLRLELAEAQIKLVETENQGGGRLHEVERQLMEARMANARLMEDNESYQLLLQEKTLKGDVFGTADFGYPFLSSSAHTASDSNGRPRSSNQDALNALEGRGSSTTATTTSTPGGSSLADELSVATEHDDETQSHVGGSIDVETQRRLESEVKSLQDQNKALTLYINKIIERLLEHQEYQYILDKSTDGKQLQPQLQPQTQPLANTNKELPPPPQAQHQQQQSQQPQQQQGVVQSFLQRTKSMASRPSAPASRPRPVSFMPETALNHPDTAPSIPIQLSRSTSVRRTSGRPMSEQFLGGTAAHRSISGGPSAASVVNAMYKGPEGPPGPLSPTLRGTQFWGTADPASVVATSSSAGRHSPTTAGNFPGAPDSSSSEDGSTPPSTATTSAQQSPPRGPTLQQQQQMQQMQQMHEKTAFVGTKPRPLRLVQENQAEQHPPPTNKRASWIGWAFGKKDDQAAQAAAATGGGGEPIRE